MPLKGLYCRTCLTVITPKNPSDLREWVEHWDRSCQEPTMDIGMLARMIHRQQQRDVWKAETIKKLGGLAFEVTEVLGGVRDNFLARHAPFWAEAQGFSSTEIGSAVGDWCEVGLELLGWETQTLVHGELFGVPVFGKVDARTPNWGRLRDYKHGGSDTLYWKIKGGFIAQEGDSAQVNCYRMLHGQMSREDTEGMELEVAYSENNKAADKKGNQLQSWHFTRAPFIDESVLHGTKIAGNLLTVGEVAQQLKELELRVQGGENPTKIQWDVARSCQEMYNKKKCSLYCSRVYTCMNGMGLDVVTLGRPRLFLPELEEWLGSGRGIPVPRVYDSPIDSSDEPQAKV